MTVVVFTRLRQFEQCAKLKFEDPRIKTGRRECACRVFFYLSTTLV